jgi:PAS domain S-box-containing protein
LSTVPDAKKHPDDFVLVRDAFQALFNSAPLPMWVYDRETLGFLAVNDAAVLLYGLSRDQFSSKTLFDIRPAGDRDELREIIDLGGYEFEDRTWRHRKANGTTIEVNVYTQAVINEDRSSALVTVIDVTKRRQIEAHVSHMAQHDAMTGLANRSLLQTKIDDALLSVRYGSRMALLCIDLDRFKEVNDSLGHAVGDELLRMTPNACSNPSMSTTRLPASAAMNLRSFSAGSAIRKMPSCLPTALSRRFPGHSR